MSAFLKEFECVGPRLTVKEFNLLKLIQAVFQTQFKMPKVMSVEEFLCDDNRFVESKAKFVIEFLKIGLECVIKKPKEIMVLTSQTKTEPGDTPAFERKEAQRRFDEREMGLQETFANPVVHADIFNRTDDIKELKDHNLRMDKEMRMIKDQLKSLVHTFAKFQVQTTDQIVSLQCQNEELKKQISEIAGGLSPRSMSIQNQTLESSRVKSAASARSKGKPKYTQKQIGKEQYIVTDPTYQLQTFEKKPIQKKSSKKQIPPQQKGYQSREISPRERVEPFAANNSYVNLQTPLYARSSQNFHQIPMKQCQSTQNKYSNIMLGESQSTTRITKKSLLNYR